MPIRGVPGASPPSVMYSQSTAGSLAATASAAITFVTNATGARCGQFGYPEFEAMFFHSLSTAAASASALAITMAFAAAAISTSDSTQWTSVSAAVSQIHATLNSGTTTAQAYANMQVGAAVRMAGWMAPYLGTISNPDAANAISYSVTILNWADARQI